MATTSSQADTSKLSFAKVAASGGKQNVALTTSFAKMAVSTTAKENRGLTTATRNDTPETHNQQDNTKLADRSIPASTQDSEGNDAEIVDAVKALSIQQNSMPSLIVNGSGSYTRDESGASSADDPFQRTDSGSDLGTKPPSLDGKSITSGTTFALDEKESLRPDDSASVKAAEDDDTFSGRGSIVAGSRYGSEVAQRPYRYDIPNDRRAILPNQEVREHGVITPQSGSSGQQVGDESTAQGLPGQIGSAEAHSMFYRQTPDEKLIEALESPKDRLFLLRLEQEVMSFVKDSKEPFVDLPPCNSFCRMLTHKLADYYHLTHQVDAAAGAIRIFRTPFCRIPESLTSISNPPTTGNTPPPNVPAMKIMRRGDNTADQSKPGSDSGTDNKNPNLSASERLALSREEREAKYAQARERIFGKGSESNGDATPETEEGNEMSRSSSASAKDKSGPGKRRGKQRREDSDSFDVRSQYTPFFPQPQPQPTWTPTPQYSSVAVPRYNGPMQPTYQSTPPSPYPQPAQQYHPQMVPGPGMQQYHPMPQQQFMQPPMPQQMPQPMPPQPQPQYQVQGPPLPAYGSPMQTPPQPAQAWPANGYQSPYQTPPRGPVVPGNTIPYMYGQLPNTSNPADPKSQHPIPGSFNRHAFNPKTQSFVPGSGGMPPQQMPHHGSPRLGHNGYAPTPSQYQMGYGMARQGSNNSIPSYHASPHMPVRPLMHQPGVPVQGPPVHHLPNYGNPSTLPPKPPPTA